MTRSDSHPAEPARDGTAVLDPTRVFPGPGPDTRSEGQGAAAGRVIVGEILRRSHRAPRPRRRAPGAVGAAVLSATSVVAGLSLLLQHQSANGPSGARQPATSAMERPPETGRSPLHPPVATSPPGAPSGSWTSGGGTAGSGTPTATPSTPPADPTAMPPVAATAQPAAATSPPPPPTPTAAGTALGTVQQPVPTSTTTSAVITVPVHGLGLGRGHNGPQRPAPPGPNHG